MNNIDLFVKCPALIYYEYYRIVKLWKYTKEEKIVALNYYYSNTTGRQSNLNYTVTKHTANINSREMTKLIKTPYKYYINLAGYEKHHKLNTLFT